MGTSGVPYNFIFLIENEIVKVIVNLFILIHIVQVLPTKNENTAYVTARLFRCAKND